MGKNMKVLVVDGHNLIPKIQGMALSDTEDENKLVTLLSEYCRLKRVQMELFFDGAPAGQGRSKNAGLVRTHYVRTGRTADDAITSYLVSLKNNARNVTVVSSDRRVQSEAKSMGSNIINSDAFSIEIRKTMSSSAVVESKRDSVLSPDEIDHWMNTFQDK
jgi:predicted RNA-binding protein with PIN domain